MNPIQPDGSFGPGEYIELDNSELETEDLQTYIAHAARLIEQPGRGALKGLAVYVERLEIALDYLYLELNRRINGKPS